MQLLTLSERQSHKSYVLKPLNICLSVGANCRGVQKLWNGHMHHWNPWPHMLQLGTLLGPDFDLL